MPKHFWFPVALLALAAAACLTNDTSARGQSTGRPTSPEAAVADDAPSAQDSSEDEQPGGIFRPSRFEVFAAGMAPSPPPGGAGEPKPAAPPPAPEERPPTPPPPPSQSPILRLASVPNMFGDSCYNGGQSMEGYLVDIPLGGAAGRVKIAENNKALPMDRVYFMYNHFHNALDTGIGFPSQTSIDRYTFGLEKMFLAGRWSAELRMPFTGGYAVGAPGYLVEGGHVGNLSLTLKRLLWATDCSSVAAGFAIDTPTGSDACATSPFLDRPLWTVHNDAVHLAPWVGFLAVPRERVFYEGFLQIDVPTNGNRLEAASRPAGILTEQTLLYLDGSLGYWLFRRPCACVFTGLATVVELHYTTTLQDADILQAGGFAFGNFANRTDILNLAVGLHGEIAGRTELRVAGVFPLRDRNFGENPFDAEVQVSLNRRF